MTDDYIIEGRTPDRGEMGHGEDEGAAEKDTSPASPPRDPPEPPQVEPAPPGDPFPDGLRDRIARVTREGGFGRDLPPTYDDPEADPSGEDWKSVRSTDPFERLFLDWRQVGSISDSMVKQHSVAIQRFWERKAKLVESGSPARTRIIQVYGDQAQLRAYERQARDDAEALATPERRTAAHEARVVTIRTGILARFEDFVVGDRVLSPAESERLLAQADAEGWGRRSAAVFLLAELDRRGFRSTSGVGPTAEEGPTDEVLLSSSWTAPGGRSGSTPEQAIGRALATAMLSGSLTAAQVQALLAAAADAGLHRENAADFVAERLGIVDGECREWRPAPGEETAASSLAEALSSVRWLSPERYTEEVQRLREQDRRELLSATAEKLSKGVLTASEARGLLAATPLDQEEAADIILDELKRRGFHPNGSQTPSGDTAAARLTSVDWKIPTHEPAPVTNPSRRWPLIVGIAAIVLVAALFATGVLPSSEDRPPDPPQATIDTQRLNVRSEPTSEGGDDTVIGQVTQDEEVPVTGYTIADDGKTWLRIDYRDREGWLSDQYVQFNRYDDVPRIDAGNLVASAPPESEEAIEEAGESAPNDPEPLGGTPPAPEIQSEPAPPPPDRLYNSSEVDRPARPAASPRAQSPPGGFSGTVNVGVEVSASGRVTSARCQSSAPQVSCAEAERRARNVRFSPAQIRGHDVRSRSEVEVVFTAPPPPRPGCTDSAVQALFVELQAIDSECRRLTDPTQKRACEARRDEVNARIHSCTQ